MSDNKITRVSRAFVFSLPKLRQLILSNNGLQYFPSCARDVWQSSLHSLHLEGNFLSLGPRGRHLGRNAEMEEQVQWLLHDIGEEFSRYDHCRDAVVCWKMCTRRMKRGWYDHGNRWKRVQLQQQEDALLLLPREISHIIAEYVWSTRHDKEWYFNNNHVDDEDSDDVTQ